MSNSTPRISNDEILAKPDDLSDIVNSLNEESKPHTRNELIEQYRLEALEALDKEFPAETTISSKYMTDPLLEFRDDEDFQRIARAELFDEDFTELFLILKDFQQDAQFFEEDIALQAELTSKNQDLSAVLEAELLEDKSGKYSELSMDVEKAYADSLKENKLDNELKLNDKENIIYQALNHRVKLEQILINNTLSIEVHARASFLIQFSGWAQNKNITDQNMMEFLLRNLESQLKNLEDDIAEEKMAS